MAVERFEDLIAWQKAQEIACQVYRNLSENRDYGFKDQIQRAAVSISNNVAEGFERNSKKDFVRFLRIASGSTSELRSMLYLSIRLEYLRPEVANRLLEDSETISKIIGGLIRSMI